MFNQRELWNFFFPEPSQITYAAQISVRISTYISLCFLLTTDFAKTPSVQFRLRDRQVFFLPLVTSGVNGVKTAMIKFSIFVCVQKEKCPLLKGIGYRVIQWWLWGQWTENVLINTVPLSTLPASHVHHQLIMFSVRGQDTIPALVTCPMYSCLTHASFCTSM